METNRRIGTPPPAIAADLCIVRQNALDPIRRIRVMSPGYAHSGALENAEPEFHPAFLHTLQRYSDLRFMDWAKANHEEASVRDWGDRAREGDHARKHSYAVGTGVPYESMIRLSNMLGASPWITLPHNASDEYCAQLALLINATLRPGLTPTLSLSNEMWHSGCALPSVSTSLALNVPSACQYPGAQCILLCKKTTDR